MTHPEELMAGYVDGALSQSERMIVDEHLAGCALCRGEVALAISARSRLDALAEQPAPAEIAAAVREALAQNPPVKTTGSRMPARYRLMTAVAAAAVVALLVVMLPHLGGSNRSTSQLAAGDNKSTSTRQGSAPQVPAGGPTLEIQSLDYTTATASRLTQVALVPAPNFSPAIASSGGYASDVVLGSAAESRSALLCLQKAFAPIPGDPVRLIQATFQGQPAFIGVFTEGPGAGLPSDTVTVRVASMSSCTVLTFTSSKI
jgi:predicted anti-sigma-YlaC factor YlaD